MRPQLEAKLFSVRDLFADNHTHYDIPIYQRNYAWRNEEIDQLVDDVLTAARDQNVDEYFLGNLIVAPRPPTAGTTYVTYEVVDGQQRLTTLFMLLKRLGVQFSATLTYASRRAATDALARLSTSEDDEGSGILTGYKVIDRRVSLMSNSGEDLKTFTEFLTERVRLVLAILPDDTDLNRYFEIMNTRGQQLEQVDIVKARLMSYLRADAQSVDEQRACLAWIWDACADMDSYVQMALTRGNTNLRGIIFGDSWDQLSVRNFSDLVARRPQGEGEAATPSESVSLRDALKIYAQAAEKPAGDDVEDGRFETPIKFPSLLLHVLKVMRVAEGEESELDGHLDDSKLIRRFDEEFKGLSEFDRSDHVKTFAEALLRSKFIIDNYLIKREFTSSNGEDGAWSLKRLIRGESVSKRGSGSKASARFPSSFAASNDESDSSPTDDGTRDVLLLQSLLRVTYTSPRTMHWITRVLKDPVHDLPKSDAASMIRKTLRSYIQQQVYQGLPDKDGPTGFHIERIVYTYLDYLLALGASNLIARDPEFIFVFRTSVEHFFPQHANSDDLGWDAVLPEDSELNMFGNLALVSVRANSKFSNALPRHKADKVQVIRQSMKLRLMASIVKKADRWDLESIRQHDSDMVDLLREDLRTSGFAI